MLMSRPIPKRESSGRFLSTADAAKLLKVTPAAVRAMEARGELEPAHVTVGGIHIYDAGYIEQRAQARELRPQMRQQLDQALGFRPAVRHEFVGAQCSLPLDGEGR